jgi:hypothetical protein
MRSHSVNRRAEEGDHEPTLGAFLDFLEREINDQPERLLPVTAELRDRMRGLSAEVRIDLDEEVEGAVDL